MSKKYIQKNNRTLNNFDELSEQMKEGTTMQTILRGIGYNQLQHTSKTITVTGWFDNLRLGLKNIFRLLPKLGEKTRISTVFSGRQTFAAMTTIFIITLIYRMQLIYKLHTSTIRPFDFNPAEISFLSFFQFALHDLLIIAVCFLFMWPISQLVQLVSDGPRKALVAKAGMALTFLFVLLFSLTYGVHQQLLFEVQSGFSYTIFREGMSINFLSQIARFTNIKNIALILFSLALCLVALKVSERIKALVTRGLLVGMAVILVMAVLAQAFTQKKIVADIAMNPLEYLINDFINNKNGAYKLNGKTSSEFVSSGLYPSSGIYADTEDLEIGASMRQTAAKKWNIVFIILESVGARYVFDTSYGKEMPMPYLKSLSEKSWFLKKHYAPSNISSRAVFSLYSGLYDFFKKDTFSTHENTQVPSIYNFMPDDYASFLVTPASKYWYFPLGFINNSAIDEFYCFENLKRLTIKKSANGDSQSQSQYYVARNEIQVADFFNQKIKEAKEPFIAGYISNVAHFPYYDYGKKYAILPDQANSIHRYYNNLRLLDHILKKIFDQLKQKKCLKNTIVIITGDHGQAFGQHYRNNYMHFRYSFGENLEAPVILYQPRIFKPRLITYPTSHIDIVPTLLDALNISYDRKLLQGESLFNKKLRRKYLFFYGHEGTVSSLSRDMIKVQYFLTRKKCQAFDLKKDPQENKPQACEGYDEQLKALFHFVMFHNKALVEYNKSIIKNNDFNGHRHQSLRKRKKSHH